MKLLPSIFPLARLLARGTGLALVALLSACVGLVQHEADTQLAAGQNEAALATLAQGLREHPESAELRVSYLQLRDKSLTAWLDQAEQAQAAGQVDEAERLLNRALALDSANARARLQLQALAVARQQSRSLQEAQALVQRGQLAGALRLIDEALKAQPAHEGLNQLRRYTLAAQRARLGQTARSGLAERRPITLDFREAGLRQVLDLVTRHSGLNFVLDKDLRSDLRISLFLKNVAVDDALDLIISTHQLARKVLDERTVLIYPNTPDKQREYQEQVVRVFYLANAEAKGAAAFLRSMLKLREPFVDERSNMVALRESAETMALAERLIGLYDTQEPEVVLELQVMELRSSRLTELGIKLPSSVTLSPLSGDGSGLTIANLKNIGEGRIGVSVGDVTINLRRETGDFEILANPRVRARNREKAKILIGDKLPIITTTTSQSGFVSDSVNYLDVGLKLELEPTVFVNDEVAVRLALEVSSLASQIKTNSGTVAYQISTRNASTALRLRNGETQVLAGLLSREDRTSASKVPLVGDVPVLGRLFASQLDDGSRTELVLAVTPRIVRNVRLPEAAEAELWVGTESYTRLRQPFALSQSESPAQMTAAGTRGSAAGSAGPSAEVATLVPTEARVNAPVSAPEDGPTQAAATQAPALVARWRGPSQVHAGEPFDLVLEGDLSAPLRGLSLRASAPAGLLKLLDTQPGGLFTEGGNEAGTTAALDAKTGALQAGVIRKAASVATGSGELLRLRLQAQAVGTLTLVDAAADLVSMRKQLPAVPLPTYTVQVQP